MKKLLTLIMPDIAVEEVENAPEEIEILSYGEEARLSDVVKRAKGKYTVVAEGDAEVAVDDGLFNKIESASADILKFNGALAFKTGVIKCVPAKSYAEKYRAEAFSVLYSKSVENLSESAPFTFKATKAFSFEDGKTVFTTAVEEFKRCKPKLPKEIYSLAVDVICAGLAPFYARALIDIRAKKLNAEDFAEFDGYLKENVVLYLALDKRLTFVDLNKIRNHGYKTGYFTYTRLKKMI